MSVIGRAAADRCVRCADTESKYILVRKMAISKGAKTGEANLLRRPFSSIRITPARREAVEALSTPTGDIENSRLFATDKGKLGRSARLQTSFLALRNRICGAGAGRITPSQAFERPLPDQAQAMQLIFQ